MDNLDDKLLSEILARLPAETLLRLKVVNKRWYSLISNNDPFFILNHASHSVYRDVVVSGLFRVDSDDFAGGNIFYVSLNDDDDTLKRQRCSPSLGLPEHQSVTILASSNGILLVRSCQKPSPQNPNNYQYYICSPTTKTTQQIPEPPIDIESISGFGLVVTFDPSAARVPLYNYKVICVSGTTAHNYWADQAPQKDYAEIYDQAPVEYIMDDNFRLTFTSFQFEIFTSDMKMWKDSDKGTISCWLSKILTDSNAVYFRGALHWQREIYGILAFHVETEESWTIKTPHRKYCKDTWFGVAKDETNLISLGYYEIFIWVLHDYDYENRWWQISSRIRTMSICSNSTVRDSYRKPIFYDSERLVLMVKDANQFIIHIHNTRTGVSKTKFLESWLGDSTKFIPHTCTLIGV